MRNLLLLMFIFFIFSCTNNKTVFWCGDHACVSKKEKDAYFKKTMTVQIKKINNETKKNYSPNEKILQQVKIDTKKRIKNEKDQAKQIKLEEKIRIKNEKDQAKQLELEEDFEIVSTFAKLREKITMKNRLRPFPDINDIQN